ncbi:MAG: glycoside hydrolase family 3 protein [Alphaproteobacteria bacterium]|nr:glycoside hydrolase family 3 protein [Alphaproteobacteria bacterium]
MTLRTYPSGDATSATQSPTTDLNLDIWPKARSPLAQDPETEARIGEILSRMSPEQKIGQILQADIASVTPEEVSQYHIGSILNGGNSSPGGKMRAPPSEWLALADAFWEASMQPDGPQIPVMWGTDAVHGHNNLTGATIFPHNINLGAARDANLVEHIGSATAMEVRATGMDWTFAPTLAVTRDDRWGRSYESYSESPDLVAELGAAMVRGLQGRPNTPQFLDADHVIATAKHFIGDGGTQDGRDQGETIATQEELRDLHSAGYYTAIGEGILSIMASFSSWKGQKMHGHKGFLTHLLKEHWAFDGLVVGDWNGHGQIPGTSTTNCPDALNAGLDMYMAPDSWKGLHASLLNQLQQGIIWQDRLDDAVKRVLRLKFRARLFTQPKPSERMHAGDYALIGCQKHRDLAAEAARKSAVLLKNANRALPLSPHQNILVAGKAADDLGMLCGGWTLSWQGEGVRKADYPHAETLLQGIRRMAEANGGSVEYAPDGIYQRTPDVAIYVFGEKPYAEFRGDLTTLDFKPGERADLQAIQRLKQAGIPVITIFLSGRPLWVNPELNHSDAFIAAFLPGSQSGAIADLLFRQENPSADLDFTGKLPFSWPEHADQYMLNQGDTDYQPLFPYGFGLSLQDTCTLGQLHENSLATEPDHGTIFDHGAPQGSWEILLTDPSGHATWRGRSLASPAAEIHAQPADLGQQENAIRVGWVHTNTATLTFLHPPLDMTREANADFYLKLVLANVPDDISGTQMSVISGSGRVRMGDLLDMHRQEETDQTLTVTIPLKKFASVGADLTSLKGIEFWKSEAGQIVVSHIGISTL